MIIKEFFALLGMDVDDSSFKKADTVLDKVKASIRLLADNALSAVGAIVQTSASYEGLKTSLITTTGSAEAAGAAFKELQAFADETPYTVDQATRAYNRMYAAGLKPSIEALRDFGDIASAQPGKTILDFVEAVADGTQGEAKRLKEFGIGLRKEGTDVELTFGDIKKTVKNNAQDIEQGIRDISKARFGGSMERQAKTLAGLWSTLKDTLSGLAYEIGESGLLEAIKEVVQGFLAWWKVNGLMVRQRIGEIFKVLLPILKAVLFVLSLMGKTLAFLLNHWKLFAVLLGSVVAAAMVVYASELLFIIAQTVLWGATSAAAGTASMIAWLKASAPLIAWAAAIALVILLIEDIWGWFSGKDSLIGAIINSWGAAWTKWLDKFTEVAPDDPWWLVAIKESVKAARELLEILHELSPKEAVEGAANNLLGGVFNITNAVDQGVRKGPVIPSKITPEEQAAMQEAFEKGLNFVANYSAVANRPAGLPAPAGITNAKAVTQTVTNPTFNFTLPEGVTDPEGIFNFVQEHVTDIFGGMLGEAKAAVKGRK